MNQESLVRTEIKTLNTKVQTKDYKQLTAPGKFKPTKSYVPIV